MRAPGWSWPHGRVKWLAELRGGHVAVSAWVRAGRLGLESLAGGTGAAHSVQKDRKEMEARRPVGLRTRMLCVA